MSATRKIAKNISILFVAYAIVYVLGFFSNVYLARYLGPDGFGIITFGMALTVILVPFVDLGFSTLTTRDVARDKSLIREYIENTFTLRIITSISVCLVMFLIINLYSLPVETLNTVYIFIVYAVLNEFSIIFYSIFRAYEELEHWSIGQIISSVILFAGVLIIINFRGNVYQFATIYLFSAIASLIYAFLTFKRRYFLPKIKVNLDFLKSKLKLSIPLSISSILSTIYFRIDTILLAAIKGNVAVGYYSAPYRLIDALFIVSSIFILAMFPVFSKLSKSSKKSLQISYSKSFKYLFIIGLPIAVGTSLLAKDIILLFYGIEYSQSILPLQILIWTVPLKYLTAVFIIILISLDKQNLVTKIFFILLIVNVILNVVLMPTFSYIGASFVTIFTEFILLILFLHYLSKFICKVNILSIIAKPIFASIVMSLFIYFSKSRVDIFFIIIISSFIYFATLFITKTFSKSDMDIFKGLFKSK